MIYYDSENFIIEWDEQNQWVKFKRSGFSTGEAYRSAALKILDLVKERKSRKMLADTSEMKVMPQEDQHWLNEVIVPQLLNAGLHYQAYVVPHSAIAQLSIKSIGSKMVDKNLEIAYFSTLPEAEAWLRSK